MNSRCAQIPVDCPTARRTGEVDPKPKLPIAWRRSATRATAVLPSKDKGSVRSTLVLSPKSSAGLGRPELAFSRLY